MKLQLSSHYKGISKQVQRSKVLRKILKSTNLFSLPKEKEIRKVDKDDNEDMRTISYKMKYINSIRFTASSLSNFVDRFAEGIDQTKCKDCIFC